MTEFIERVNEQDRVIGVVERGQAVREGWLYRMAMVLCRDPQGRYLVHRRPDSSSRFPGQYSWLVAGAVSVGETYTAAASRELHEELGVRATVHPLFKFRCEGELGPYFFAVNQVKVDPNSIAPSSSEVAWHGWLSKRALEDSIWTWPYVQDSRDAYTRYLQHQKEQAD
ncbi:NUDIX domain-containing protein [Streptomyces sp. NPDC088124]|uniref:NUDIX hydrolase n=1 Tax=Streptomyces sp. NPDC088124 TaxID=3154654 RepID=UPI00341B89CA